MKSFSRRLPVSFRTKRIVHCLIPLQQSHCRHQAQFSTATGDSVAASSSPTTTSSTNTSIPLSIYQKLMKPRSSTTAKTTKDGAVAIDDPCWGDQDHCSLEYLLSLLSRSTTILYESENYIMMNKPADLRMDGPYPATVHKLISYWFPPPSLQHLKNDSVQLLEKIKYLDNHSDVPDKDQWRPCHQLDYATSGVLLLARTSEAAAWASSCFEARSVQKKYMAVLHGHLQPNCQKEENNNSIKADDGVEKESTKGGEGSSSDKTSAFSAPLPVLCPKRLKQFVEQQEQEYIRRQHKRRQETFHGFQPPNAFVQRKY